MTFDAAAYAEGICNQAAGSSIEALVDLIDETRRCLKAYGNDLAPLRGHPIGDELFADAKRASDRWGEVRAAIVDHETENGEATTFASEETQ